MSNIKCSECGLVNWPDQIECKRCQALLTVQEKKAEQISPFTNEERPFFSTGLKLVSGLLGLTFLSLIAFRVLGIEHSDLALGISLTLSLTALALFLVSHVWLVIRIFEQSIGWGLASLVVPLVGLVAIIKFWEYTRRSFVAQLFSFVSMIVATQIFVKG